MLRHFEEYMLEPLKLDMYSFNKKFTNINFYSVKLGKAEIINLEGEILSNTGFRICKPPVLDFINLFATLTDVHPTAVRVANKYAMILPFFNNIWQLQCSILATSLLKLGISLTNKHESIWAELFSKIWLSSAKVWIGYHKKDAVKFKVNIESSDFSSLLRE